MNNGLISAPVAASPVYDSYTSLKGDFNTLRDSRKKVTVDNSPEVTDK